MQPSLAHDLHALRSIPLLTPSEALFLAARIQAWVDLQQPSADDSLGARRASNRLVTANLWLLVSLCQRRQRRKGVPGIDLPDPSGTIRLPERVRVLADGASVPHSHSAQTLNRDQLVQQLGSPSGGLALVMDPQRRLRPLSLDLPAARPHGWSPCRTSAPPSSRSSPRRPMNGWMHSCVSSGFRNGSCCPPPIWWSSVPALSASPHARN